MLPLVYHFLYKLFPLRRAHLIIENIQGLKSSRFYLFALNNNWLIIWRLSFSLLIVMGGMWWFSRKFFKTLREEKLIVNSYYLKVRAQWRCLHPWMGAIQHPVHCVCLGVTSKIKGKLETSTPRAGKYPHSGKLGKTLVLNVMISKRKSLARGRHSLSSFTVRKVGCPLNKDRCWSKYLEFSH